MPCCVKLVKSWKITAGQKLLSPALGMHLLINRNTAVMKAYVDKQCMAWVLWQAMMLVHQTQR